MPDRSEHSGRRPAWWIRRWTRVRRNPDGTWHAAYTLRRNDKRSSWAVNRTTADEARDALWEWLGVDVSPGARPKCPHCTDGFVDDEWVCKRCEGHGYVLTDDEVTR